MATSGTTTTQLNRNQIINAALRKLTVLAKGQTADSEDLTYGTEALLAIVAKMQTIGMPLWARKTYTFPLTLSTSEYEIGIGKTLNTSYPLKLHQAFAVDTTSDISVELNHESIYSYNRLTGTAATGTPVHIFYQPLINYGLITLWPTPDASAVANKEIKLIYQRPFEELEDAADEPDFPREWSQAIIYELAIVLAPEYGTPLEDRKALIAEYTMWKQEALGFGEEEVSFMIQPEVRWRP